MPPITPDTPPLDLGSLLTNLGILIAAVAAVIGGIWTGWQQVKKSIRADGESNPSNVRVLGASIMENITLRELTESNRALTEVQRQVSTRLDDLIEVLRENRTATRSDTEESHRLRIAVNDVHELLRAMRK